MESYIEGYKERDSFKSLDEFFNAFRCGQHSSSFKPTYFEDGEMECGRAFRTIGGLVKVASYYNIGEVTVDDIVKYLNNNSEHYRIGFCKKVDALTVNCLNETPYNDDWKYLYRNYYARRDDEKMEMIDRVGVDGYSFNTLFKDYVENN